MNKDGTRRIMLDHEFAMELYLHGLADAEIAKQSGVRSGAVCKWRNKLGLPPNKEKRRGKLSSLARDAMEARRLGLTYGQYKAQSYVSPSPAGRGRKKGDYRGL